VSHNTNDVGYAPFSAIGTVTPDLDLLVDRPMNKPD
jgi:hypothetical protein